MSEIRMLFCFLLAFALAGCSILSKPENQPVARLAIQYAVLKVVEGAGDPAHQQARAERIKLIALDVQSLVKSDEQSTVPALDTLIRSKVPWDKLSPADTLLASNLIAVIEQELQNRVGTGTLTPEQMLVISDVIQWVIDATAFAVPHAV